MSPTIVNKDETFLHHLAVIISRSLNTLNPNEVLAARVFQLSSSLGSLPLFTKAISSFGKFTDQSSSEIWDLCQEQDTIEHAFQLPGLTITDHDTLAPEVRGRAGLSTGSGSDKHVFKTPSIPRGSILGLDRLATEKRRERGETDPKTNVKRIKYDDDDEAEEQSNLFKSASFLSLFFSRSTILTHDYNDVKFLRSLHQHTLDNDPKTRLHMVVDYRM